MASLPKEPVLAQTHAFVEQADGRGRSAQSASHAKFEGAFTLAAGIAFVALTSARIMTSLRPDSWAGRRASYTVKVDGVPLVTPDDPSV